MGKPLKGRITHYDPQKAYGFIDAGTDGKVFFHKDSIKSGTPVVGAEATGEYESAERGPKALFVRIAAAAPGGASPSASAAPGGRVDAPLPPFYVDAEKTQIRAELLGEEAEARARELVGEGLNSTQLRRFFEEVRHLERVVHAQGFAVARPLVRMLAAKAHYAQGRGKIRDGFRLFLSQHAKAIADQKDFDAFVKAFEALVGYYYFLAPKRA
ncbi:MAG: type III-A CRISPR-associated protein Csm2 [Planctomycetes bacterium]|nr:type III-A CRISPR-associated protein Csm2 [Planctomycetota bacterium]